MFCAQVREIHSGIAASGQTDAPKPTADLDFHFVALVQVNGRLYELGARFSCRPSHSTGTSFCTMSKYAVCAPTCLLIVCVPSSFADK